VPTSFNEPHIVIMTHTCPISGINKEKNYLQVHMTRTKEKVKPSFSLGITSK